MAAESREGSGASGIELHDATVETAAYSHVAGTAAAPSTGSGETWSGDNISSFSVHPIVSAWQQLLKPQLRPQSKPHPHPASSLHHSSSRFPDLGLKQLLATVQPCAIFTDDYTHPVGSAVLHQLAAVEPSLHIVSIDSECLWPYYSFASPPSPPPPCHPSDGLLPHNNFSAAMWSLIFDGCYQGQGSLGSLKSSPIPASTRTSSRSVPGNSTPPFPSEKDPCNFRVFLAHANSAAKKLNGLKPGPRSSDVATTTAATAATAALSSFNQHDQSKETVEGVYRAPLFGSSTAAANEALSFVIASRIMRQASTSIVLDWADVADGLEHYFNSEAARRGTNRGAKLGANVDASLRAKMFHRLHPFSPTFFSSDTAEALSRKILLRSISAVSAAPDTATASNISCNISAPFAGTSSTTTAGIASIEGAKVKRSADTGAYTHPDFNTMQYADMSAKEQAALLSLLIMAGVLSPHRVVEHLRLSVEVLACSEAMLLSSPPDQAVAGEAGAAEASAAAEEDRGGGGGGGGESGVSGSVVSLKTLHELVASMLIRREYSLIVLQKMAAPHQRSTTCPVSCMRAGCSSGVNFSFRSADSTVFRDWRLRTGSSTPRIGKEFAGTINSTEQDVISTTTTARLSAEPANIALNAVLSSTPGSVQWMRLLPARALAQVRALDSLFEAQIKIDLEFLQHHSPQPIGPHQTPNWAAAEATPSTSAVAIPHAFVEKAVTPGFGRVTAPAGGGCPLTASSIAQTAAYATVTPHSAIHNAELGYCSHREGHHNHRNHPNNRHQEEESASFKTVDQKKLPLIPGRAVPVQLGDSMDSEVRATLEQLTALGWESQEKAVGQLVAVLIARLFQQALQKGHVAGGNIPQSLSFEHLPPVDGVTVTGSPCAVVSSAIYYAYLLLTTHSLADYNASSNTSSAHACGVIELLASVECFINQISCAVLVCGEEDALHPTSSSDRGGSAAQKGGVDVVVDGKSAEWCEMSYYAASGALIGAESTSLPINTTEGTAADDGVAVGCANATDAISSPAVQLVLSLLCSLG